MFGFGNDMPQAPNFSSMSIGGAQQANPGIPAFQQAMQSEARTEIKYKAFRVRQFDLGNRDDVVDLEEILLRCIDHSTPVLNDEGQEEKFILMGKLENFNREGDFVILLQWVVCEIIKPESPSGVVHPDDAKKD